MFSERDITRFWSKVNKADDCWLWLGRRDKDGYGVFAAAKKTWRAHRVVWLITQKHIPTGMFVCHTDRVWWLDHHKPDPESRGYKQQWQRIEAGHIRFVAMTRARRELRLFRSEGLTAVE